MMASDLIFASGIVIAFFIGIFLICALLRLWWQGPAKGSDNPKRLDGKVRVQYTNSYVYIQTNIRGKERERLQWGLHVCSVIWYKHTGCYFYICRLQCINRNWWGENNQQRCLHWKTRNIIQELQQMKESDSNSTNCGEAIESRTLILPCNLLRSGWAFPIVHHILGTIGKLSAASLLNRNTKGVQCLVHGGTKPEAGFLKSCSRVRHD